MNTADNNRSLELQERHMQPHMLVRRTIALVSAGGRGSRLKQWTERRATPAGSFGGSAGGRPVTARFGPGPGGGGGASGSSARADGG